MKTIKTAKYQKDFCFIVEFSDGKKVCMNLSDFIQKSKNPLINQFNPERLKNEIEIAPDGLDWNNDLTISAQSIYDGEFSQPQCRDSNHCICSS